MKKIFSIIIVALLALSFYGCSATPPVQVNVDNKDNLSNTAFGEDAMVEIGGYLWYDSTTRIVYWWNGIMNEYRSDTVPTPYYAPNGLPYRYNPETNTFEEIEIYKGE